MKMFLIKNCRLKMFLNTEILLFAKKEKENKYSAEATKIPS